MSAAKDVLTARQIETGALLTASPVPDLEEMDVLVKECRFSGLVFSRTSPREARKHSRVAAL